MKKKQGKYIIIGVDEAGRGPLAGPIAVAAIVATVMGPANPKLKILNSKQVQNIKFKNQKFLKGIRDSKKFSPKQRNEWMKVLKKSFEYSVTMVGPQIIDRIGIQRATKLAVARALRNLLRNKLRNKLPDHVLLDGLLAAPKCYSQQTIIRGDQTVPLISAASIIAKVHRDKKMKRLHKIYPEYCFECHKGYGTKMHYKKIKKNGLLPIHRRSFLKNLI